MLYKILTDLYLPLQIHLPLSSTFKANQFLPTSYRPLLIALKLLHLSASASWVLVLQEPHVFIPKLFVLVLLIVVFMWFNLMLH